MGNAQALRWLAPGAANAAGLARRRGNPKAGCPSRGNLAAGLAYSMSRSCAGGMRGGEGDITSPPVTVA